MPTYAINRRAKHDYEIKERLEAGIKLTGPEVKSVKLGRADLTGSYARIEANGEMFLINASIPPYPPAHSAQIQYNTIRNRKLLLNRKEIDSLIGKGKSQGVTLIPLSIYGKKGIIKVELGLGRGKRKHDKRETIKKREIDRKIRQKILS